MACGLALVLQLARTRSGSLSGTSAQARPRVWICPATARQATSLLQRERCDGHGFAKNDPEFDTSDASSIGSGPATVEFKKRPTGIMRYSHGKDGKGAIVLEMQEKSRYPGDPKGQAAVGGVQKFFVIKSIAGQECIDWSFIDIMDLLDDYEFQPTDTKEAKEEWVARERKHKAADLPVTVEFVECAVKEVDEDAVIVKEEGKWYPRSSGFTDAQLAEELENAKKKYPVPADYSGVVYAGPDSMDEAWIKAFMEQQRNGIMLPAAMAYALVIDAIAPQEREHHVRVRGAGR